ncbi:MAG: nuclear transport factor 2 family protein [Actinomycetota bacterium]
MEHPHAVQARALLEAVSAGEFDRLGEHLAGDIVWHVGGEHDLSGHYRGREAVLAYLERVAALTHGSLRLEPIDILASDNSLGIFLRATASLEGHSIDTTMVEAVRLDGNGLWAEFWALADDQAGVDDFWRALSR